MDESGGKGALQAAWLNGLRGAVIENGGNNGDEPPKLGVQLPTSLEDLRQSFQQGQLPGATAVKKPWYKTPVFTQVALVVGLFLVVFLLLVVIQPPFLNTRPPENEPDEPKFSAANAAWFAFASSLVCGIIFGVLAVLDAKKRKAARLQLRA